MIRMMLLSMALVVGFGASAASAGTKASSEDETLRAFLKNRQIKWQRVNVDAPHALTGRAQAASVKDDAAFRVAPRHRAGFRR
ncbi:MAG: hypothetical protein QNK05_08265 [Myxococcota bacterium]|nr:hypothetical protein [Myxococcota bacterium]